MSDTNEYEERARAAKSFHLIRAAEKLRWPADSMALLTDEGWRHVAKVAGVKPPSDRTKAIVLHVLRERSNG